MSTFDTQYIKRPHQLHNKIEIVEFNYKATWICWV